MHHDVPHRPRFAGRGSRPLLASYAEDDVLANLRRAGEVVG